MDYVDMIDFSEQKIVNFKYMKDINIPNKSFDQLMGYQKEWEAHFEREWLTKVVGTFDDERFRKEQRERLGNGGIFYAT